MTSIHPPKQANKKGALPVPLESVEQEADRKWKEAFENTTEEEFIWLEKKFVEEEKKQGVTPIDRAVK